MPQTNLLYKFSGITALFSFAYFIVSLLMNFVLFDYLMLFDSLVFGIISYCAFKLPQWRQQLLSNLYIGFFILETFVVSAFSGGTDSMVLPWFSVTPILALLLLGKKETFIWSGICFLTILLLIPTNILTSKSKWYFETSDIPPIFNTSLNIGLLFMLVLLTWLFAEKNKQLQIQLSENIEELKATEEELRQNMEELSATQDFLTESNDKLKEAITQTNQKNIALKESHDFIKTQKEKVENFSKTLYNLTRSKPMRQGNHEDTLKLIVKEAAHALGVDRSSIWFYTNEAKAISCSIQYDKLVPDTFESGMVLHEEDFPVYMGKIKTEESIIAVDANTHADTFEFCESYLKPNHIQSMLDIPLMLNAQAIGVVCFEHRHTFKQWDEEDHAFAMSIADLITISIQASEKHLATVQIQRQKDEIEQQHGLLQTLTAELQHINKSLEARVKERTAELEEKNKSLAEYTFINVHLLRAPMCQIMGLSGLLKYTELDQEQTDLIKRLDFSTKELEQLIKRTTQVLETGQKLDRTLL